MILCFASITLKYLELKAREFLTYFPFIASDTNYSLTLVDQQILPNKG